MIVNKVFTRKIKIFIYLTLDQGVSGSNPDRAAMKKP